MYIYIYIDAQSSSTMQMAMIELWSHKWQPQSGYGCHVSLHTCAHKILSRALIRLLLLLLFLNFTVFFSFFFFFNQVFNFSFLFIRVFLGCNLMTPFRLGFHNSIIINAFHVVIWTTRDRPPLTIQLCPFCPSL